MQPQGTSVTNPDYVTRLTAEINSINTCADLQRLANEAMATIQAEVVAVEAQINALLPVLSLLQIPSINTIISWVTGFINSVLKPIVVPYTTYLTQLVQTLKEVAQLVVAIEAAAARIVNCAISIPAVVVTVTLPPPS